MKRRYLILFLTLFSPLLALAQDSEIKLSSKWENKNAVISIERKPRGTFTLLVMFSTLENSLDSKNQTFVVTHNERLITLKPISKNIRLNYSYTYTYVRGNCKAKIDDKQPYRIPLSTSKPAIINYLFNVDERYFGKSNAESWKSFQFIGNKDDTLFAMRKGQVVSIINDHEKPEYNASYASENNSIIVEHADGTLARYSMLKKDSFMVKEGDMVYPDTALALLGTLDNETFETRVIIYYPQLKKEVPEIELSYRNWFCWKYIDPLFSTTEGTKKLETHKQYTPLVTKELITFEMTKKEIKKWGLN